MTTAGEPTGVFRGPGWPDDHVGADLASADTDGDGKWDLGIAAPDRDNGDGSFWWLNGL